MSARSTGRFWPSSASTHLRISARPIERHATHRRELVAIENAVDLVEIARVGQAEPLARVGGAELLGGLDAPLHILEAEAKLRIAFAEGRKQVEIDQLQAELDALTTQAITGPAAIRAAVPPEALIRQSAQTRVAGTKIRDLRPHLFWAAARQSNQQAIAAAARQDVEAAILAQQQYLVNLALYREATRALELLTEWSKDKDTR